MTPQNEEDGEGGEEGSKIFDEAVMIK